MELKNAEIKAFKHNINNELFHLQDLLHSREMEEALLYLNKMTGQLSNIDQITRDHTGSRIVTANWYALTNDDKYKDITTTWKGRFPVDFSLDTRDIVLLFSNLLANAFEAAVQSPNGGFVEVKASKKANRFSFLIRNSCVGKVRKLPNGDFLTSKLDKENHGIGTRIIRDTVKKYDGDIVFDDHIEGEFAVLIVFHENI